LPPHITVGERGDRTANEKEGNHHRGVKGRVAIGEKKMLGRAIKPAARRENTKIDGGDAGSPIAAPKKRHPQSRRDEDSLLSRHRARRGDTVLRREGKAHRQTQEKLYLPRTDRSTIK